MQRKILFILPLVAALCACVTTPKPLLGQFAALQPGDAVAREQPGDAVRWGGRIVDVQTEKLHTCFEIVAAPLDSSSRPRRVDDSSGRFIACRSGFYEPEVFAPGRELTITGHVEGFETRKVGDYDYRYPRVEADVVYLWPEYDPHEHDWMYAPYYGWGAGWGWYGRW